MNIKKLRKQTLAPFALSVLKRAIEINPDEPDVETAISEYAEKMRERATRYDFYFVMPNGNDELSVGKVSSEIEKNQVIYKLLAAKEKDGNLEQKNIDAIMAMYGENIKVHPTRTFTLKGDLNNYFSTSHYLSMIGINTVPAISRSELTDEILKTLAKNALCYHLDYQTKVESLKGNIKHFEEMIAEHRDHNIRRRLNEVKKELDEIPAFDQFLLEQSMEFGDSIVAKSYSSFYSSKTIKEYIRIATKKLMQTLNIPELEIKIVQCDVYDLA